MNVVMHPHTKMRLDALLKNPYGTVLLHGPAGIGKYTMALDVARQLNCQGCTDQSCASCRQALGANHPNIVRIESDEKGKIGIEAAQSLTRQLQYSAYASAGKRVVLIRAVERLTIPAANALLKILEEPPVDTFVIMTASNTSSLLQTIVSRSRPVYIARPGKDQVLQFLAEDCHIGLAGSREIAEFSEGLPALAVSLARDEDLWEQRRQVYAVATRFTKGNLFERLLISSQISKEASNIQHYLNAIAQTIRVNVRAGLMEGRTIENVLRARENLAANISPKNTIDALAVDLP